MTNPVRAVFLQRNPARFLTNMDPFAVSLSEFDLDLFEEVESVASQTPSADTAAADASFQAQNFEAAWNEKEDLSDEEKSLFPENMDYGLLFPTSSQDPFLSSAATLDIMLPVASVDDFPENVDGMRNFPENGDDGSSMRTAAPHIDDHCYVNTPPASPLLSDDGGKENDDDPEVIMYEDSSTESDECDTIKEEEDDCVEPIPQPEEEEDSGSAKPELITRRKKTRRGKKKPKANAWSSQKKALVRDSDVEKVVKLYEQKPFENPALEKCRQNALNAKLNRERKKKEKEQMEGEVARLRSENARLRRAEAAAARRAGEAERELQRLRALLGRSDVGAAAVETAKACKRKHGATERARSACPTCSLGNKQAGKRLPLKAR